MPWYNILRAQDGRINGFIVDEDDVPVEHDTEEEAIEAIQGHVAQAYIDTIEID